MQNIWKKRILENGREAKLEKYYNIKHNTFLRKTFSYDIIKTPGHTDDSISIFFGGQNLLFSGDLIFYHSIGRYDFPNSNYNDLIKSLEKISKLSLDTTIFPGHGEKTSLNEEIKYFDLY